MPYGIKIRAVLIHKKNFVVVISKDKACVQNNNN
jgi:hypothetical protein